MSSRLDAASLRPPRPAPGTGVRIIGAEGPFLDWGVGLCERVFADRGLPTLRADLASPPPAGDATPLLIGHGPGLRAASPMAARNLPTLLFLDDAATLLGHALRIHGDPVDATRAVTHTLAPLAGATTEAATLRITRAEAGDAAALARRIADFLLPASGPGASAAIDPPPDLQAAIPIKTVAQMLLRQIIAPMHAMAAGGPPQRIVWPLVALLSSDIPGELALPVTEAIGPARALCFGPYFSLPGGRWRVAAECFFSDGMEETQMAVDVAGPRDSGRFEFTPPGPGVFIVAFTLDVNHPQDQLEARLWTLRGAIKGRAGVWQFTFQPA